MKVFKDFKTFSAFIDKVDKDYAKHEKAMLEAMAEYIKEKAKGKFGHYQDEIGPFNAWQSLAPATQDQRVRLGYTPDDPLLRRGDLKESIKAEVEGRVAVVGSEDPIMLWQEDGTEVNGVQRIPPRPVLGPAAFESKLMLNKIALQAVKAMFSGKAPISKTIGTKLS